MPPKSILRWSALQVKLKPGREIFKSMQTCHARWLHNPLGQGSATFVQLILWKELRPLSTRWTGSRLRNIFVPDSEPLQRKRVRFLHGVLKSTRQNLDAALFGRFFPSGINSTGFSTEYDIPSKMQQTITPARKDVCSFPALIFITSPTRIGWIPEGSSLLLTAGVIAREKDEQIGAPETFMKTPALTSLMILRWTVLSKRLHCGPSLKSTVNTQPAPWKMAALAKTPHTGI